MDTDTYVFMAIVLALMVLGMGVGWFVGAAPSREFKIRGPLMMLGLFGIMIGIVGFYVATK